MEASLGGGERGGFPLGRVVVYDTIVKINFAHVLRDGIQRTCVLVILGSGRLNPGATIALSRFVYTKLDFHHLEPEMLRHSILRMV